MKIHQICLLLLLGCAGQMDPAIANNCETGTYQPRQLNADTGFKIRGFHLDLRVQVMKMPALKALAKSLHAKGFNTLLVEWEASYPFEKHRIISSRYAYTREEIKSFIAYCNALQIEVIPLQQSFGHVEYILKHQRYASLREDEKDYSQVNPTKEAQCRELFAELYRDLASTHTSSYIHIGGDETSLLGRSAASRKKADSLGMGRLYGDYLQMLCELVISMGKIPIVWADIALKYPEALKQIPRQTVFIDWNYGWAPDRFGDHDKLLHSGFRIWGAPAIRSGPDNYFLTAWKKHFDNLSTFIPLTRQWGYEGIITTSWSTSGVYSPVFESEQDAIEINAVRRVYPLTGFDLLIEASAKAVNNAGQFNTGEFINSYGRNRYGFTPQQSLDFWNALTAAPFGISNGKVTGAAISIAHLQDSIDHCRKVLAALKPLKNQEEFRHYLLMVDIRAFYIACKKVEESMNQPGFTPEKVPVLLQELNNLKPEELNRKFIALNRHAYYLSELELENAVRNKRYYQLKAILEHINP